MFKILKCHGPHQGLLCRVIGQLPCCHGNIFHLLNNSTKTKIKMVREGYTEENTVTLSSHLVLSSYILPQTHEYTAFVCSCVAPHIKVAVVQLDYFFFCSSSVCLCN